MELEDEVSVSWSPNARVVIGSRLAPLVAAALLGLLVGFALGFAAGRRGRRFGDTERMPPLRLPDANPDVETEL